MYHTTYHTTSKEVEKVRIYRIYSFNLRVHSFSHIDT